MSTMRVTTSILVAFLSMTAAFAPAPAPPLVRARPTARFHIAGTAREPTASDLFWDAVEKVCTLVRWSALLYTKQPQPILKLNHPTGVRLLDRHREGVDGSAVRRWLEPPAFTPGSLSQLNPKP